MSTQDLAYKFVSELDEATYISANDLLLVSQIERTEADKSRIEDIEVEDGTYKSKYLKYSKLCSIITQDIDDKISNSMSSYIEILSIQISSNLCSITELSNTQKDHLSAIIKMANCIQVNKSNIGTLSCVLSSVRGINGITVEKPNTKNWTIGHTFFDEDNLDEEKLVKIKYDKFGHITGRSDVTYNDISAILSGNVLSGATNGIEVNDKQQVSLLTATTNVIGGVKIDNSKSSIYNLNINADGTLSARDTQYGIATSTVAGVIKANGTEFQGKNYPVQISSDFAYVNVPWTDSGKQAGEYTKTIGNAYATISSIHMNNGVLSSFGTSTKLYDTISALSSAVYSLEIPKLSAKYLGDNNNVSMKIKSNSLYLCLSDLNIASVQLSAFHSKDLCAVTYVSQKIDEGVITLGNYLKFDFSNSLESLYCDVQSLKDTFVESAWYDATTNKIYLKFNDSSHSNIEVPLSSFSNGINTIVSNEICSRISVDNILSSKYEALSTLLFGLRQESWQFTLSNGTTVTKSVLAKTVS